MSVKVFIDGSSGTTGLRIADRLAQRPEIELLSISAEGRKDVNERAKVINSADLAFLCLPDAAAMPAALSALPARWWSWALSRQSIPSAAPASPATPAAAKR